MGSVSVKFFATIRDVVGEEEIRVNIADNCTVGELKNLLIERFPDLKNHLDTVLVASNLKFAYDDDILEDGFDVALFPPVSGGESSTTSQMTVRNC